MKFLLILALPVIVASFVLERFLGCRRLKLHGRVRVGIGGEAALAKLLRAQDNASTEIAVKKLSLNGPVRDGQVILSTHEAEDETASSVGRAVWLAGLAQIEATSPQLLKWWRAARTFGTIGVPLIWIVLIFALVSTQMSSGVILSLAVLTLAASAGFCLLQLPMNLQAVRYGVALLEKARLFNRLDDEEAVEKCASAHAYLEVLPHCLGFLRKS